MPHPGAGAKVAEETRAPGVSRAGSRPFMLFWEAGVAQGCLPKRLKAGLRKRRGLAALRLRASASLIGGNRPAKSCAPHKNAGVWFNRPKKRSRRAILPFLREPLARRMPGILRNAFA